MTLIEDDAGFLGKMDFRLVVQVSVSRFALLRDIQVVKVFRVLILFFMRGAMGGLGKGHREILLNGLGHSLLREIGK